MLYWIGELIPAFDAPIISELSQRFDLRVHESVPNSTEQFDCRQARAVILNLPDPLADGAALVDAVARQLPDTPIILRAPAAEPTAIANFRQRGVVACVTEHTSAERIAGFVHESLRRDTLRIMKPVRGERPAWRASLVGESPAIECIARNISLIANRRATVLITGETGTGKEVVARAIHAASNRRSQPLVTVNCGALPESLLESELFGHARGAFTGAVGQRVGRFEQANRGSIFLDEIGDMPISAQTALLRVLQEREFQRVGGTESVRVDVRVIAATNVNLDQAVANKTFRPDLLYRLHVFPIHVPPLRQRKEDIEPLAEHFIRKVCSEEGLTPKSIAPSALSRLTEYHWPGNVRQLGHAIETALVVSGDRTTLTADDFSLPAHESTHTIEETPMMELPDDGVDFEELVNDVQRGILQLALERAGGNKSRAACLLNMKRSTLVSKMKALAG